MPFVTPVSWKHVVEHSVDAEGDDWDMSEQEETLRFSLLRVCVRLFLTTAVAVAAPFVAEQFESTRHFVGPGSLRGFFEDVPRGLIDLGDGSAPLDTDLAQGASLSVTLINAAVLWLFVSASWALLSKPIRAAAFTVFTSVALAAILTAFSVAGNTLRVPRVTPTPSCDMLAVYPFFFRSLGLMGLFAVTHALGAHPLADEVEGSKVRVCCGRHICTASWLTINGLLGQVLVAFVTVPLFVFGAPLRASTTAVVLAWALNAAAACVMTVTNMGALIVEVQNCVRAVRQSPLAHFTAIRVARVLGVSVVAVSQLLAGSTLAFLPSDSSVCPAYFFDTSLPVPSARWPAPCDGSEGCFAVVRGSIAQRSLMLWTGMIHFLAATVVVILAAQANVAATREQDAKRATTRMRQALQYISHEARAPLGGAILSMGLLDDAMASTDVARANLLISDLHLSLEAAQRQLTDLLVFDEDNAGLDDQAGPLASEDDTSAPGGGATGTWRWAQIGEDELSGVRSAFAGACKAEGIDLVLRAQLPWSHIALDERVDRIMAQARGEALPGDSESPTAGVGHNAKAACAPERAAGTEDDAFSPTPPSQGDGDAGPAARRTSFRGRGFKTTTEPGGRQPSGPTAPGILQLSARGAAPSSGGSASRLASLRLSARHAEARQPLFHSALQVTTTTSAAPPTPVPRQRRRSLSVGATTRATLSDDDACAGDATAEAEVFVDLDRVMAIVQNALSNSIKHAPGGGAGAIAVSLSLGPAADLPGREPRRAPARETRGSVERSPNASGSRPAAPGGVTPAEPPQTSMGATGPAGGASPGAESRSSRAGLADGAPGAPAGPLQRRVLWIEVLDNGQGIPAELLQPGRLFRPFQQLRQGDGSLRMTSSGLGLSIVKSVVVEQLHGVIGLASREGEGTLFVAKVPVWARRAEHLPLRSGPPFASAGGGAHAFSGHGSLFGSRSGHTRSSSRRSGVDRSAGQGGGRATGGSPGGKRATAAATAAAVAGGKHGVAVRSGAPPQGAPPHAAVAADSAGDATDLSDRPTVAPPPPPAASMPLSAKPSFRAESPRSASGSRNDRAARRKRAEKAAAEPLPAASDAKPVVTVTATARATAGLASTAGGATPAGSHATGSPAAVTAAGSPEVTTSAARSRLERSERRKLRQRDRKRGAAQGGKERPAADVTAAGPSATGLDTAGAESQDRRVAFVVDDERVNRTLLARLLRGWGFETVEMDDGLGLVESVRALVAGGDAAAWPSVVTLDIQMPGLDGFASLEAMAAIEAEARAAGEDAAADRVRGLVVVGVTGNAVLRDRERMLRLGARAVLTKPVDPCGLAARIEAACQLKLPERAHRRIGTAI